MAIAERLLPVLACGFTYLLLRPQGEVKYNLAGHIGAIAAGCIAAIVLSPSPFLTFSVIAGSVLALAALITLAERHFHQP